MKSRHALVEWVIIWESGDMNSGSSKPSVCLTSPLHILASVLNLFLLSVFLFLFLVLGIEPIST